MAEDDDLDLAWQRYRLEGLAAGWWQDFRLETLEDLSRLHDRNRNGVSLAWALQGASYAVMCCAFLLIVKAYVSQTGGFIVVPDGVYSFHDLEALEPAKLLKLGLPLPALPPPEPLPIAPPPFLRFLLSAGHDVSPPA